MDTTNFKQKPPSFQKMIFSTVAKIMGNKDVRTVSLQVIKLCKDLETGFFLSQLIYWTGKEKSPYGWIYKTDKEWHDELSLSSYSIRKARKNLVQMRIIETKKKRANGFPTIHYRIDKKAFWEKLKQHLDVQNQISDSVESNPRSCKIDKTITDNTTEISTKNTKPGKGSNTGPRVASGVPLSFEDFCKQHPIDREAALVIAYFLDQHKRHMNDEHPKLKPGHWQELADTIFADIDGDYESHPVDSKALRMMIDKYFNTEFQLGCNYSIMHFNSEAVKKNRYYEIRNLLG